MVVRVGSIAIQAPYMQSVDSRNGTQLHSFTVCVTLSGLPYSRQACYYAGRIYGIEQKYNE